MITDEMLSILKDIKERLEAMESIVQGGRIVMMTQEEMDLSLAKQICTEEKSDLNPYVTVSHSFTDYGNKTCVLVTLHVTTIASCTFLGEDGNMECSPRQRLLASIQRRYKSEGGKTPITLCIQYGQT